MSKWKCGICNSEFDNFQAQGFGGDIYCPLCYYKELYKRDKKEIDRLNNIINGLEKWLNEYYKSNRKWYNTELSNHDKQYYGEIYRNTEFMIVKFLKQLKELKEKHEN